MRIIPFLFEHVEWRDLFWSPIAVSEVCVFVCVCVGAHTYVHMACVRTCYSIVKLLVHDLGCRMKVQHH